MLGNVVSPFLFINSYLSTYRTLGLQKYATLPCIRSHLVSSLMHSVS